MAEDTRYEIKPTSIYKKDFRRVKKQGRDIGVLTEVLERLANGIALDEPYRDHGLSGKFKGCRECHLQPDWLLIYKVDNKTLYLYLMRTGSHSELFQL